MLLHQFALKEKHKKLLIGLTGQQYRCSRKHEKKIPRHRTGMAEYKLFQTSG